jgi:hypothetical protein
MLRSALPFCSSKSEQSCAEIAKRSRGDLRLRGKQNDVALYTLTRAAASSGDL